MTTSRTLALVGVGALTLGAAGLGLLSAPAPASAQPKAAAPKAGGGATFTADPVHSSVVFKIRHMGVSDFYGSFTKTSGSFTLGDTLSADITVDAASVNTNNPKRDEHVRGPDFFNASEFPKITFVAKDLAKSGDGVFKGTGSLTLNGQTKPVAVEIATATGKGMKPGSEVAGINTTFTIKQSDFKIKGVGGGLSDEVTLMVGVEGGK